MNSKEYSGKGKKLIAACMAAALCATTGFVVNNTGNTVEAAGTIMGDLSGNDKLDLPDASAALKFALGIDNATEADIAVGDINKDGKIGLDDVTTILKGALGIIEIKNPTATPEETPDVTPTSSPSNIFTPPPKTSSPAVPMVTMTPAPTSIPLPEVTPGDAVSGTAISKLSDEALNGAEYDAATGIYTFTDANKTAKRGIQFNNPWAGRTELRQTVEDALPSYLQDSDSKLLGVIKNGNLVSLDGKTVIGAIEEKDGYLEVKTATSSAVTADAAEVSESSVITGTAVKWNESLMPVVDSIDSKVQYLSDYSELYAKPSWSNGVSLSFWCKYNWAVAGQSDAAPMLVIKNSSGCDNEAGGEFAKAGHTGDFAFMLRLNGGVSLEGDESGNCFKADNCVAGNDGEWNYYTVTFANDWITVYVNGQELVYYEVNMDKDEIGFFNNGFLTRYSPVYEVAKSDVTDVRNYLKKGWLSKSGQTVDVLDKEYSVIGNSRYKNPDAVTIKKNSNGIKYDLLVDLLTKEDTQIWFGSSSDTKCVCLTSPKSTGSTEYKLQSGTQFTDVNCYDSELKPQEVSANYAKEYAANAERLGLTK